MSIHDTRAHRLRSFFTPHSIALVGASPDAALIRGRIFSAVTECGYPGKVFPISRSHRQINGIECYESIDALPEAPELAIITVPAEVVPRLLGECATKGTRAALILSSGFAEQGDEEGAAREEAVRRIASEYDMVVCGPNAEGFFNAGLPLTATFSPTVMELADAPLHRRGRVAIVSQSGGIGFAIFDRGRPKGLNVSYIVSLGNEVELQSTEVLDYLVDDAETDVIAMFVEGFKRAGAFRSVARKANRAGKPIVVAKMGRSMQAARAAVSHTATLAGSYRSYEGVFRHHGITTVDDVEQLVDTCNAFACFKGRRAAGKRVAVLAASGGAGIWLTDTCVAAGLDVVELDAPTQMALSAMMPAYGSTRNPVDITAQGVFTFGYSGPLEAVAASPVVDMILVTCSMARPDVFAKDIGKLAKLARSTAKPVLFCGYTSIHPDVVRYLTEAGFPCTNSMPNACHALLAFAQHCEHRERQVHAESPGDVAPLTPVIDALDGEHAVLCEYRAREVLAAAGFEMGEAWLATDEVQAVQAFRRAGAPVALKLQSPSFVHKSDVGGVLLGLSDEEAVRAGFNSVMCAARKQDAQAVIDGVLVQPMTKAGVEVVLGVHGDADFGPMLMIGLGGVLVEVLADVVFSPVPLTTSDAHVLIESLEGYALLQGLRGGEPADVAALAELAVRVANFAATYGSRVSEIDLNPIVVHRRGEGVSIVDALIVKSATAES